MTMLSPHQVDVVGYVAAALTTSAFIPQLQRIVKLRSAHEISLGTFSMYSVGVMLWFVYGFALKSKPMIVSNSVALGVSVAILLLKVKYDKRGRQKELEP